MKFRRTLTSTVVGDLRAFADFLVEATHGERTMAAAWLNEYLDELAGEDVFGTEAQLDPRGDRRD